VTIAIDTGTPVRSDTQARIDVQGLMGSPSIALSGGSPNLPAPAASKGEPPLLVADASAGQDLTQSAREVLGRIDKILAENSNSLHDTIANFDTFSAALARNSKGIDTILAGLEKTFGGETSKGPLPTYDLTASQVAVAPSKKPAKSLWSQIRRPRSGTTRKESLSSQATDKARSWTMRNGPIARRSFFKPKSSRAWKTRISWPGSDAPPMV